MLTELDIASILLWGLFATGLLTIVLSGSQGLGWTRISLPFMVGSIFSPRRRSAMIAGIVVHMLLGLLFAILYALAFEAWNRSTWWLGSLLGLYHGLFMLVVCMPLLPVVHPRMAGKHQGPTPTKQLEPPGFLALNYGYRTPLITLLAHIVFGFVLGIFYQPV